MTRRAVITGIGVVTPLGTGKGDFGAALRRGDSGIGPISAFPTEGLPSGLGAEVRAFDPRAYLSLKNLRKMDRLSAMTAAAARMALDDAGIAVTEGHRERVGIVMGTAFGNTEQKVQSARTLFTAGPGQVSPLHVPNTVMNAPAGHASIELGFTGVNTTVNHQAVSAETAIAYGAMEIGRGAADVVLVGGVEILSPFFYEALTRFFGPSPGRSGGPEAARPFDRRRNGYVAGEGCGILCLEAQDRAESRQAQVYAMVAGWGFASSPEAPTAWPEDPGGLLLAQRRALAAAGTAPDGVGIVDMAANGGIQPDGLEAQAYDRLFSPAGPRPLITALKGAIGESFAAAGGIRAAALALSLREGLVPPIVGLREPLALLPFVRKETSTTGPRLGLLNGVSFGGTYVCLVLTA